MGAGISCVRPGAGRQVDSENGACRDRPERRPDGRRRDPGPVLGGGEVPARAAVAAMVRPRVPLVRASGNRNVARSAAWWGRRRPRVTRGPAGLAAPAAAPDRRIRCRGRRPDGGPSGGVCGHVELCRLRADSRTRAQPLCHDARTADVLGRPDRGPGGVYLSERSRQRSARPPPRPRQQLQNWAESRWPVRSSG